MVRRFYLPKNTAQVCSSHSTHAEPSRESQPLTSADVAWLCIFILIGTWASFALAGVAQ
jgi:hypothetical protein